METVISELAQDETFMRGITKAGLEYTSESYLKYEYLLPEDELKKFLETVNSIAALKGGQTASALDIGAATGRYPSLLARRGIRAYGVDLEPRAMEFAAKKRGDAEWPEFLVGDAVGLPVQSSVFDLVTCMMGTFAHITKQHQKKAVAEMLRVLRPSGMIIVSPRHLEC
jgi:ubiquinone/menaquinone biosynthesis C-methylase UbiE